ncbi:tryptophan 2,3-dioxygenase family protein [Micromonospora sonneratiae]|uniref:Tryptophan 2,3-dioxygenase family protein n=1 Tax=Micromonospora sonneratiae TaxID=1184706 RepID=A0ABW3YHM4_9ACTN
MRLVHKLTTWLSGAADPDTFPYSEVVTELHRTGRHFADKELLALLDQTRTYLTTSPYPDATEPGGESAPVRLLRSFLDVALDKWDGRYDYHSYLALGLLGIPGADPGGDGAAADPERARRQGDRILLQLIADALAFEMAAEAGTTGLLPQQRPAPVVVAKRYRLGVRAAAPPLSRLGLSVPLDEGNPAATAALLNAVVAADQSAEERRNLGLSMLPVYLLHDEYLFIRVLQAYECTFALLAVELQATIDALAAGLAQPAADCLAHAEERLRHAAPLFSLMASMQPQSFRTFRIYTEGASAIQSRSYKLMESLCRTPTESRLASAAYRSVPGIRSQVLAGQPTVDQAYRSAAHAGRLTQPQQHLLEQRMRGFAAAVMQWRQTHYRLATRMLGTGQPGTGYTEGTPYLAAARSIPVFTAVTRDADSTRPTDTEMEASPSE